LVIKCPECGGQVSDQAQACPHCGAPISPPPQNDSGGCCLFGIIKAVLVFLLTLAVGFAIVAGIGALSSRKTGKASSPSSYSSLAPGTGSSTTKPAASSTPSQPSRDAFGDEAEKIAEDFKKEFEDYSVSWTANGYDLRITVRVADLSGDDLADMFEADPSGAQKLIDQLAESMRAANQSIVDRLKAKGFQSFTVETQMITSDGVEFSAAVNGVITKSISQDNFKYG
jgi:hypothetical protein